MATSANIRHVLYKSPTTVTDPGSAGTIIFDKDGGVCPVITAGAEARTIQTPTKAGINGAVVHKTAGGILTLTVTGGYNNDADTTIAIPATAGLYVKFFSIEYGGAYYWRIAHQEGTNVTGETLAVDSLTLAGVAVSAGDMTEGAAGITAGVGTTCQHSVTKVGGLIKTEIVVDLTGLNSSSAGDIIGVNSAADCHIGQITAAINGTIIGGRMSCLETPAGGEDDVDLCSLSISTGTEDVAASGLTGHALLLDAAADWTGVLAPKNLTALPAANSYLYLLGSGGATAGTYTAGVFVIELWGK